MKNKKSCIVVFSGGQDSTTCLFWAARRYEKIIALTFEYGQRHVREIEAAEKIIQYARANVPDTEFSHQIIKLGKVLQGTSPLVSDSKLEQYKDFHSLPGGLEKTFVPGRNALFLMLASNVAYVNNISDIITGVCQEDFGGYPDCRAVFIKSLGESMSLAMDRGISFITPLMYLSKAETVKMAWQDKDGHAYKALSYSHTSYDGAYPPTGKDHATLLRQKGFDEFGVPDPLIVRAVSEGLMELPSGNAYDPSNLRVMASSGWFPFELKVPKHREGDL